MVNSTAPTAMHGLFRRRKLLDVLAQLPGHYSEEQLIRLASDTNIHIAHPGRIARVEGSATPSSYSSRLKFL
jgi:hypothetical protein